MSTLDQKIIELQNDIAKRQQALAKVSKFRPETNCSLTYEGRHYNLHQLQKDDAILLLVKLSSIQRGCDELAISYLTLSGYTVDLWVKDLKAKLEYLGASEKKAELDRKEKQLKTLLSEEKKREQAFEDIAKSLGES